MKKTKGQKIRLGIFVIVSTTILLLLIGLFTTQKIFRERDIYYVAYDDMSVSGLEVGSPVKYLGIKVGYIEDISIDPDDVSRIIVTLALKPDTPIKEDARADITTVGITGLKTIEIQGGSNEADFLDERSYLNPGSSMTEEITGKAEVIAEKVESVLNNLQDFTQPEKLNKITIMADKISLLADKAGYTIESIDTILAENRSEVRRTIVTARDISNRLDTTSMMMQSTIDKINSIISSDTIQQILGSAQIFAQKMQESDLERLVEELVEVANQTNQVLSKVDHELSINSEDFSESMILLKNTLENLNEVSRQINDNPSILIRGTKFNNAPDQHLTNK